jgi:ubiquinone/menaquinone biosynthesis C-methylase UbiE
MGFRDVGSEKMEDTSTRSWEAAADDWVAHADTNDYRNHFLMPRMLALLGDVRGKKILDLGCGEGGYSRELAKRGAEVKAVDGSARLIDVAAQRAAQENLEIATFCANANALPMIADESLDVVMAAMSLMDVEDYGGAIAEAARVLKAGGELVMSISHPCFTGTVAEWQRDANDRSRLLFFKVDRYFERKAWEDLITDRFTAPVVRRHRILEDYMREPLARGLRLVEFIEPEPTEAELSKSPRFAKIARIPYFLFMRWRKD